VECIGFQTLKNGFDSCITCLETILKSMAGYDLGGLVPVHFSIFTLVRRPPNQGLLFLGAKSRVTSYP